MTVGLPTILIADDEPDILDLLDYLLTRSGYIVIKARDGEEALRLAIDHIPDLAVLDVMMPKMDGYELTRKLKENQTTRGIPVILLTARAENADIRRGLASGADDYLNKPFKQEVFVRRVGTLLGRQ